MFTVSDGKTNRFCKIIIIVMLEALKAYLFLFFLKDNLVKAFLFWDFFYFIVDYRELKGLVVQ